MRTRDDCQDTADAGAATVWTAIAISALLALTGSLLLLGTATVTRHRAGHAADLAALAAASRYERGRDSACDVASSVVTKMGGRLGRCEWQGWDALITVRIAPDGVLRWFGVAEGRARAGPVKAE